MTMVLHRVAEADGVHVNVSGGSSITYFNSPYYSHQHCTAVDLYPKSDHDATAHSPVDGKVVKVYAFKSPRSRYFIAPVVEQLLLLKAYRSNLYIRLLHVETRLKAGETIRVGDEIGSFIRSGFFNFWTGLHVHVEVRRGVNLLRAKGSLPINPRNPSSMIEGQTGIAKLTVVAVTNDFLLLRSASILTIGAYSGVGCTVDSQPGILEGGIPYYAYGGVHIASHHKCQRGATVRLGSVPLGRISEVQGDVAMFMVEPVEMRVNDLQIRGLSLFLAFGLNHLFKAVPFQPGDFHGFRAGEAAHLQLKLPSP